MALLALLVAFPLMGVLAVSCIGLLVLQKLRLQTRLDDSSWWLIDYSDITIIRESTVRTHERTHRPGWGCAWGLLFNAVSFLQGVRGFSLSNTASHNGSGGSQSDFSSNSYGLKDKTGKENIYTTIGLYQVAALRGYAGEQDQPHHLWLILLSFCTTCAGPSCVLRFTQGNQVAIKYIKNPGSTNFQRPSIVREFTVVSVVVPVPVSLLDVSLQLNVVVLFVFF